MKFKKFIKDNIKRISSVILCIVLIFSLSITTYAFDGEAGGLDKEMLNEYIEDATVLYNYTNSAVGDVPVYSPFNHTTLYYILKWPLTNEGWIVANDEYLAITTFVSGVNHYRTYYLIPEWNTELNGNYFFSALHEDFEFPDLYSLIWLENYGSSPATVLKNYSILSDVGTAAYMNGYIYTVEHGRDNLIHSVSELYYGSYVECLKKMPYSGTSSFSVIQIHYGSKSELSRPIPEGKTIEKVKAKNLNYLVSSSTYSVSAYDYFDTEASYNSFVSSDISFTYLSRSSSYLYVPECIRGPNFPSNYNYLSYRVSDANYYLKEDGYFNSDRAFIYIPYYPSSSSALYFYTIVFPEGIKSPILYLKFCAGGGGGFFQLLSKVDYEVYGFDGTLAGTFDAETTTYNCIKGTINGYTPFSYNVSTSSNPFMVSGSEYITYPCIIHSSVKNKIYLGDFYGNSVTLSMFPKNANTLGFYTYVSPNIVSEVLDKGNTGTVGGNIFDNIGGGGFPSDTDWEKMWDFTIDYDSFESDAFKGYERSPYPDMPFATLEDINLFTLPDDILTYMTQCIQWFGDELTRFTEYVGGPVAKVTTMMKMMFENAPDFLGTLFLLFFFFFAIMKIMQFDTAQLLVSGSADIYTGMKRDERIKEQRLEKEERKREKQNKNNKKDGGS